MPLNLCGHATLLAKLMLHAFNQFLVFFYLSIDSLDVNTCYKKLTFRQNHSMNYCHHITFFMHFSIVHVNILFNWEKKIFTDAITFDNFT